MGAQVLFGEQSVGDLCCSRSLSFLQYFISIDDSTFKPLQVGEYFFEHFVFLLEVTFGEHTDDDVRHFRELNGRSI